MRPLKSPDIFKDRDRVVALSPRRELPVPEEGGRNNDGLVYLGARAP
jgi:hypothetical protein